jgi:hypothetical protein
MVQELIDLRASILEGRYEDALALVDELAWMSKKATLRNIKNYSIRMLIHLIKNQVEQRLTNSWAASIRDSLLEIQDLNLMDNRTSYYINREEWEPFLETALAAAIRSASVEVRNGAYNPFQLMNLVDQGLILATAQSLIALTYQHPAKTLPAVIDEALSQLAGGEEWKLGSQR